MAHATSRRTCRYGLRLMRRRPAFTAAAVLTIALGMGATTAMFSVVYGVSLRPLPFGEPDDARRALDHRAHGTAPRVRRRGQRRDWRAQTACSRTSPSCAPSATSI